MPSDAIFDRLGRVLSEGDTVLFIPWDPWRTDEPKLTWGTVDAFVNNTVVVIDERKIALLTMASKCIKFTDEERTIYKLKAEL